ncbi:MAG: penicillin-binding protein 2 [Anaerolineales bacterium]|jgi:penicillin-binding protein 2
MANASGSRHVPRWRLQVTYGLMAAITILFLGRLISLQIIQGDYYRELADENRFTNVNIAAPRGVIYDRNGFQLVNNIPSYNVYITAAYLPDSEAEQELIFERISELTGVPIDQEGPPAAPCVPGRGIKQLVLEGSTNRPYDPWPIACDINATAARVLREWQADMPGVSVDAVPVREYNTGELTANLIGYMVPIPAALKDYYEDQGFDASRDKVGYAGIEGMYQDVLAGSNGRKLVEVDVAGLQIREYGTVTQPVAGNNLRLTIDTRLQDVARAALDLRIDLINTYAGERRAPLGAAIAMNPQTGEILAMVSLPTYENNRFARFIPYDYYEQLITDTRGRPLVNHAISLEQPPGSTFKMVTALGILNEGVVTPTQEIFDPGEITISNAYYPNDPGQAKSFVCWKEEGHGYISYLDAIAESCNIYFYKVGGGFPGEVNVGLGIDRVGMYARALGYGAPLGIDLIGEESGLIPNPYWKRIHLGESWSTGDTYNAVTGQGFVLATPLQVLTSISTIANGGRVMWPHMVSDILDGEGNVVQHIDPCVLWDISDGVITPLENIGANCPTLPADLRQEIIESRETTPDMNIEPWVIELAQEGMLKVTTEGTAHGRADLENISSGGKTGTGEFCDEVSREKNLCSPGNWPTHSWYVGFAPFENPEIVVVAFVYNGGEGAVTAGPVVRQILEAYFELKAVDAATQ